MNTKKYIDLKGGWKNGFNYLNKMVELDTNHELNINKKLITIKDALIYMQNIMILMFLILLYSVT